MCNDLFYSLTKIFNRFLTAKRQRLTSTQFRKMALFVSVYDDNFYLATNLSWLIQPRFAQAKIRSHFPRHRVLGILCFKQQKHKLHRIYPMATHSYRDRSCIYILCIYLDFTHSEQKCRNKEKLSVTRFYCKKRGFKMFSTFSPNA